MLELIIALILGGVILIFGLIFIIWMQDAIPRKFNEISAEGEMDKFENSPAALYAVTQIVNNMSIEIMNEPRPKTKKTINVYYMFSVESREVHGRATSEYDSELAGITDSWSYDFCKNRYPDLESDAERTALATVIAKKAVYELRKRFP